MKNGFTVVEVSILFVIFLIVAFLVAPLSLDDTKQAQNTARWKSVQSDFINIFYTINTNRNEENINFAEAFNSVISTEMKESIEPYRISYMNGTYPSNTYRFREFKTTQSKATIAVKLFDESENGLLGVLMYDVNGKAAPNTWGRDVFGMNIYEDRFEPFGKSEPIGRQKQDCSLNGTGLYCSNYYLIGGNFD